MGPWAGRTAAAVCSAMLFGASAAAQSPSVIDPAAAPVEAVATTEISPPCELHVWPSDGFTRNISTMLSRGDTGVIGLMIGAARSDGDKKMRIPDASDDALSVVAQTTLLNDMAVPDIIGLPGHRLVVHDQALESRVIRNSPGRIAPSTSPCYAELVIDDVAFQREAFGARHLKTLFRYRDFGSGQQPQRRFGTWANTRLEHFPPETDADKTAAAADLHSAFRANLVLFAQYLSKASHGENEKK